MAGKKSAAAVKRRQAKHNPGAFLDLPPQACDYETARAVILPLPYEASVSYGSGTAAGPAAILEASTQVELYDPEFDCEPALAYGIHTLAAPEIFSLKDRQEPENVLDAIAKETARHARQGKFVIGLGGEHTVSVGVAQGLAAVRGSFVLVHIDAHSDLRDSYEDNPYSHACAARRIADLPECEAILQFGIRSTSPDQVAFVREHAAKTGLRPLVKVWSPEALEDAGWKKEFKKLVKGRKVFFTFDVDGLDPSVIPATGTPEPNGLSWRQLLRIACLTAKHAYAVIGMDCVELSPRPELVYADFAAARAVYALANLFLACAP